MLYQVPELKAPQLLENSFCRYSKSMFSPFTLNLTMNRLSDPTAVTRGADWLDLNTFPHAEYALPSTRRLLNTWKTGFAITTSQCSCHLCWIMPWIQTFWSHCSDTRCWQTRSEYLFTCGICCTKDQKAPQHLEHRFCHYVKSMFCQFMLNQTVNTDFLILLLWLAVLTD